LARIEEIGYNQFMDGSVSRIAVEGTSMSAGFSEEDRRMLDAMQIDVNERQQCDFSLLHEAAKDGDAGFAEYLLSKGAHVNLADETGWTPLHMAAMAGSRPIVMMLLSRGAKVNARTHAGLTPLRLAAVFGHNTVVKRLRMHGGRG
jgi:ankyrin repeat protein